MDPTGRASTSAAPDVAVLTFVTKLGTYCTNQSTVFFGSCPQPSPRPAAAVAGLDGALCCAREGAVWGIPAGVRGGPWLFWVRHTTGAQGTVERGGDRGAGKAAEVPPLTARASSTGFHRIHGAGSASLYVIRLLVCLRGALFALPLAQTIIHPAASQIPSQKLHSSTRAPSSQPFLTFPSTQFLLHVPAHPDLCRDFVPCPVPSLHSDSCLQQISYLQRTPCLVTERRRVSLVAPRFAAWFPRLFDCPGWSPSFRPLAAAYRCCLLASTFFGSRKRVWTEG